MGPTNVALVKLFQADQQLREAKQRLDATTKNVRVQERRVPTISPTHRSRPTKRSRSSSPAGTSTWTSRRATRTSRSSAPSSSKAKNNKEYQAFLIEINTGKVDRNKVEDEAMKIDGNRRKVAAELKELTAQLEGEQAKLAQMQTDIGAKVAAASGGDRIDQARARGTRRRPCRPRHWRRLIGWPSALDGEAMSAHHQARSPR